MQRYGRTMFGVVVILTGSIIGYFGGPDKTRIEDIEKLVLLGVEANAVADSSHKITITETLRGKVGAHEAIYIFIVNDQTYHGIYNPPGKTKRSARKLKYLEEDPTINSIDPERELKSLKASSRIAFCLGLFFSATGGWIVFASISRIGQLKKIKENRAN